MFSGDGSSYHVGDFIIMPNHVHALLLPNLERSLENVLKSVKGISSRACNLLLERTGQFWQPESYDHIVRTLEQFVHYREYIRANPKKAGTEVHPEAYYRAAWMDGWLNEAPCSADL